MTGRLVSVRGKVSARGKVSGRGKGLGEPSPQGPVIAAHNAINLANVNDGGTIVTHAGHTADEAAHAAFEKGNAIEQ
jgi:phosphohistidine swiveling domain-containing protein